MKIRFDDYGGLTIRAAGFFREGDHVLLHRNRAEDFWSLVGGSADFLERTEAALIREVREELGVSCQVNRLVWVVENFFHYSGDGRDWHGIEFNYELSSPELSPRIIMDPIPAEPQLIAHWFHISELADLQIYPEFLRERLAQPLPAHIEHLVNNGLNRPRSGQTGSRVVDK